jgi:hypothetical protein
MTQRWRKMDSNLYGVFPVKWLFLVFCRFFVRSWKAVLRPVACDQVRGARGRGQGTETVAKLGGLPPSDACVSQPLTAEVRFAADSPLEGDGFELPVPGRIYSAAMRSQVISRCSSLSPVRRGGRSMVQLAWRFLRFQKESALALWYRVRTADRRMGTRKTMIVALARKLVVALWRFVTTGEPLEGVVLRPAS